MLGLDAIIFIFWMLSFKSAFSLSSFTFIKSLFSSFSLSTIRVVSCISDVIDISPSNLESSNLDSMLNSRDITLLTNVCIVKTMAFQVVIYGYKCWSIKKNEHWGTDAFKLWCLRRLLRVPLDCKEIEPVNPKRTQLWIFIVRTDAEAKAPVIWPSDAKSSLILGKIEGRRRKEWQRMR